MAIEIKPLAAGERLKEKASGPFELPLVNNRASLKHRILILERLALLLETGVPLHSGLRILSQQEDNLKIKAIIDKIVDDITAGDSFSRALTKHPEIFPSTHINLIAAAEKGGFIPEILKQLIAMDEKNEKLRNTVIAALFYPGFLILFSIAVIVFVLTVIFPKFAEVFEGIHDQLPITTIFLMALSDMIRQYWMVMLTVGSALLAVLIKWLKTPDGNSFFDHLKLRTPVIKGIYTQIYLTQIMRVMGLSLNNGVTIIDTLRSCRDIIKNSIMQNLIAEVEDQVIKGGGIARGFHESEFVPPMVRQMISTGETSGNLPLVMEKAANYYENELTKRISTLSKLIEPIMLMVMGVLVGLIVSSLILPIFKLSSAVH